MRGVLQIYEVRIKDNGKPQTKHTEASSPSQAKKKALKYGQVVSVRKVDYTKIFGDIEKLDLNQPPLIEYVENSPYTTAVAMDEMIWQKRNKRLKNKGKDKNRLDK